MKNRLIVVVSCQFILLLILGTIGFSACSKKTSFESTEITQKNASSAITITPDGEIVIAVNPDSNSLTLLDAKQFEVIVEISVGLDPRTVAVDPSGRWAVTANRAAGTISLIDLKKMQETKEITIGALPWGVVISPLERTAYVACEDEDWITAVDYGNGKVLNTIAVEDRPNGLALSRDGETLYVTHLLSARISVIDLPSLTVSTVFPTWVDGNLSQSILLNLDGTKAYLPMTRSNTSNERLTFDTTLFPLVTVVDLENEAMLPKEIISLPEADQPVALPYDAVFSPDGKELFVVNAASNDLSVIDMDTGLGIAHLQVGSNPRGVTISPDGAWLFVNNTLDGTISVIDAQRITLTTVVPVTEIPLPPILLEGKRLFNSSQHPELSRDGWISCNSCHWEGEQDGRTWIFSFAGPRNTTSLLGMINTYPLRWSAEWDESADSEFAIREEQFGSGLIDDEMHPTLGDPNTGRSQELDSLALFIDSLSYLPNYQQDHYDPKLIAEGEEIFFDPVVGCASCHSGPYYTDFLTHDIGTANGELEVMGPMIDTPTLLSLERSAPYLHDGSAKTIMDVLTTANPQDLHGKTSHLSKEKLEALSEYLLSLDKFGLDE